ncbi:MAG TPA: hypothetical protein PK760_07815 [Flavobacteriales bacterium]|nr:hypothetical protein [Flavobacteriales bacterium]
MERREHYDPEDIESLLAERSFDELLEEERAYVLRHLSGREEYEAMRLLLTNVRMDERDQAPLQPDADVRMNVMAAFRAQQVPQWRIWLNSLTALFAAGEARANTLWYERAWRPALAFASIAVLIVAGVKLASRTSSMSEHKQVAELHAPKKESTAKRDEGPLQKNEEQAASKPQATATTTEGLNSAPPPPAVFELRAATEAAKDEAPVEVDVASAEKALDEPVRAMEEQTAAAMDMADERVKQPMLYDSVTRAATGASHVVTQAELATNMSTTNASPVTITREVSAKMKFSPAVATTSLAAAPELLALLNTGW